MKLKFLVLLAFLISCSGGDSNKSSLNPDVAPITEGNWYRPKPLVSWQWQLTGVINSSYDVEIYDIDLFETEKGLISALQTSGHKVICYFSAGSYEEWRSDAEQFNENDLGNALDGWPGERWLDIRSSHVHELMKSRLDLAKEKGCDGVEPDNMDGYTNNPGFNFTARDQLAFNRFIANEAHLRDLSVALKNDLNQIEDLVDYYDFAVNEQCFQYSECNLLAPFIDADKAVLTAEYQSEYIENSAARDELCVDALSKNFSTLILPLDLDDEFRFACVAE
jgi:hypothetical protein